MRDYGVSSLSSRSTSSPPPPALLSCIFILTCCIQLLAILADTSSSSFLSCILLMGPARLKVTHSIPIGTSQGSEPSVTSNSVACWLDPQRRARLAAQPQSRPRFRRHIFTNTSASLDSCLTDLLSDSKICPPRPSRCSSPSPTHCQPSCATQKPPWIYTTVRLVHISCVTSFVHSWRRLSPPAPPSQVSASRSPPRSQTPAVIVTHERQYIPECCEENTFARATRRYLVQA